MSTERSRQVLHDCETLLAAIKSDISSNLWRPRWAGLVALLRAVGHVLVSENPKTDPIGYGVVSGAKTALLKAPIFAEFIKKERDNVLKTYTAAVGVRTIMTPGTAGGGSGEPTTYEAFVGSGPYKAQDPLQLCEQAIDFWKHYLDAIDAQVLKAAGGKS